MSDNITLIVQQPAPINLTVQPNAPAPVRIVSQQGPAGPVGPIGPIGLPGGVWYVYTQASVSAQWIVNHNLGFRPNIDVTTLGGAKINAEILHVSDNQVHLFFVVATAGQARFN
jgi:hypothetical protein